tara:strand:- start:225 stop:470 length:246 start_codon:yes stop_codon:yes gene_type:complete
MTTFFETFFSEKDLDDQVYEVKVNETYHLIPTSIVIDQIKTTTGAEAEKIETILRKIDFLNGDVHHFLKHLAQGIAFNYGK